LQSLCPWATAFTDIPFVTTWFAVYRDVYEPVLVWARNESGRLTGLFLLGHSSKRGVLVPAGGRDAEYDTWLAEPGDGDGFIESALYLLAERFPQATLRFQYLAAGTPIAWAARGRWASRCELEPVARALRTVGDGSSFRESLKKKSNKSRYNRLERLGKLEFVRITSPEEFPSVLDTVADFSDFRHGAVHASLPFRVDPLRKRFYLELQRIPRLLHVSVLRSPDELLAAHVGFYNRDQVLLGIITHSPIFSAQSPGKILMLLLGLELAEEGVPTFDLTPGTLSGYKDRFATHHDQVHILTVSFDRNQARRLQWIRELADAGRSCLAAAGWQPGEVRGTAAGALGVIREILRIRALPNTIRRYWWYCRETRVYRFDLGPAPIPPDTPPMLRDHVPSLLAFTPAGAAGPTLPEFLSASLARMESGGHVYTAVQSGRLTHSVWLEGMDRLTMKDVGQEMELPPDSLVAGDFFTAPDFPRGRHCLASLRHVLNESAAALTAKHVYVAVAGDDADLRNALEEAGFLQEQSFWRRKRLWSERKWGS
jgi:CelD/BcsL family acetyltransferase involved in cellulose biosynthesis